MKKILLFFTCLLFAGGVLWAQNIQVSGVVTDASDRSPLAGATILVKGTNTIALSGIDGKFVISAPSNGALLISFIGMATTEVNINGRSVINVALENDAQLLQDVVVVAYGIQRKEAVTGAVATVKAETLEKRPVSSATAALEGMALGVQVNNSYGEPGQDPTFRIRGFNSINGTNNPLFVVDGVPMSGNVSDIHSNDIESITVLKDASSAALYGNKASNGVVMITTKSGRMGEDNLIVQANLNFGVYQRAMKDYERLNAEQYMEAYWMSRRNALFTDYPTRYSTWSDANADALGLVKDGLQYNIFNKDWNSLFDSNGKLAAGTQMLSGYVGDMDWWKPLVRTGMRNDYNVSARGGSKRAAYFMSIGYLDEQGYTKQSDMERFTGNMKIDVKPTKWLKTGFSMRGTHLILNSMSGDGGTSYINPFYFARNVAPIYPVHLHDPKTGEYILDAEGNKIWDDGTLIDDIKRPQNNSRHIAWETELNKDRTWRNTIDANAYIDITFLSDFVFSFRGDINNRNYQNQTYNNALVGDGKGSNGRMSESNERYKNITLQQLLTWKRTFNGVHNVDVLLGHENYSLMRQYSYAYKTDQKFANLMQLINFNVMTQLYGQQYTDRTEGYLSRAGYNYDNKYFFEGSIRYDGSSRFYKDKRWGIFWSAGGSWVVTREKFMAGVDWVDYLKLRAAYGVAGMNASAGYYAWMALYYAASNGGNGALYKSQNEAKDVVWEKTGSMSIALESRLFKRASLSIEYYDKRSIDLLFNVTMPSSYGAVVNGTATGAATSTTGNRPTILKNLGTMSNRGVEVGLSVDVVQKREFNWNLSANFNYLKNKIVKLPDEYKGDGYVSGQFKRLEGHSMQDFWLFQFVGIDKSDGRSLYLLDDNLFYIPDAGYTGSGAKKEKDETRTVMAAANYKIIDGEAYVYNTTYGKKDWSGSSIAPVYGSFSTSLSYKGFQLSGLVTYQLGGKAYASSYLGLMSMTASPSAVHLDLLKSWTPEQAGNGIDPKGTPALNTSLSSFNNATSTRILVSSNYFAIKNVTLSYMIPQKPLEKIGLKGLAVSLTAENLAIFTKLQGLDPQQLWSGTSENYFQPSRVVSLGLNVKF